MEAWLRRLTSHVPPGQLGRYLVVGTSNTLFGYATFAGFVALLDSKMAHGYILASILSSIVNITYSFLGYKWFVFKTKGNYLREWTRALAVYASGIAIGAFILPVVVEALRYGAGLGRSAPYVAGAIMTGVGVVYNFFGHKKFSFRQPSEA